MTTSLYELARFRSRVTLEPYAAARAALLADMPWPTVVPRAGASQRVLEGLVFQAIRNLYCPDREEYRALSGAFQLIRIRPATNRLSVEIDPGLGGTARTLGLRLLPEVEPGGGYLSGGVPGLRMRDRGAGIEFRRIGHQGSVVFRGIAAAQFRQSHDYYLGAGHECPAARSPQVMTEVERRDAGYISEPELDMTSSVVRRIGLLRRLGATGIDTWIKTSGLVCVEAFLPALTREQYFDLVSDLCSPHLAPRWDYLGRMGADPAAESWCPQFSLADRSCQLDLRLRRDL